jgi:hypothetical protein
MTLDFITQNDVATPCEFTLNAIAAAMMFPGNLPLAADWMKMQRLFRGHANRETADRANLLSMLDEAVCIDIRGLQARAARGHGDGMAAGIYTVIRLEKGSAREALRKTREITGALSGGLPFDKDMARSKYWPVAHLWAAHTHFLAHKAVPCKSDHLADFLGMARAYQLELEDEGRELVRLPDYLRLPSYLIQTVGERRSNARAAPKALAHGGGLPVGRLPV